MKIKYIEFIFVMITLIVTLFNMICFAVDGLTNKTSDLPEGEFVAEYPNYDNSAVVKIYSATLNGVCTAIRGEVVKSSGGETKNIYWQLDESNAQVQWVGKNTVYINGNAVNINGDPYDGRSKIKLPEASLKNMMKNK